MDFSDKDFKTAWYKTCEIGDYLCVWTDQITGGHWAFPAESYKFWYPQAHDLFEVMDKFKKNHEEYVKVKNLRTNKIYDFNPYDIRMLHHANYMKDI